MIQEQYVSFETAKLLMETDFDEPCYSYYETDTGRFIQSWSVHPIMNKTNPCFFGNAAPTQQMAMRWLREEKYILIFVVPAKDEQGNLEYLADVWIWNEEEGLYEPHWAISNYVYEEAVEAAILHCLKNLISD